MADHTNWLLSRMDDHSKATNEILKEILEELKKQTELLGHLEYLKSIDEGVGQVGKNTW